MKKLNFYALSRVRANQPEITRTALTPVENVEVIGSWSGVRLWLSYLCRVWPVVIVGFCLLIYGSSLAYGLYLDDNHHARPWRLDEVLGTFYGPFDPLGIEPVYFRPLTVVSFALDWSIWGYNSWGYHLTNLIIYALAAVVLKILLQRLGLPWYLALLGSLFFIIVPMNAATAVYISERNDGLVAIFTFSALLAFHNYWDARRLRWLVLANALYVLAICSKEIGGVVSLLFVLYYAWLLWKAASLQESLAPQENEGFVARQLHIVGRVWRLLGPGKNWKQLLMVFGPPLVILVIYGLYRRLLFPNYAFVQTYKSGGNPVSAYASAVFSTIKAIPWFGFQPWVSLIMGVGLVLLAIFERKSALWNYFFFGLAWIVVACLPLALLLGFIDPRLLFLPSVGLVICWVAMVGMIFQAWEKLKNTKKYWPVLAVLVVIGISTFSLAAIQNQDAQKDYAPFSENTLGHDLEIYNDPNMRARYPRFNIERMREKLIQAGKLDPSSR